MRTYFTSILLSSFLSQARPPEPPLPQHSLNPPLHLPPHLSLCPSSSSFSAALEPPPAQSAQNPDDSFTLYQTCIRMWWSGRTGRRRRKTGWCGRQGRGNFLSSARRAHLWSSLKRGLLSLPLLFAHLLFPSKAFALNRQKKKEPKNKTEKQDRG